MNSSRGTATQRLTTMNNAVAMTNMPIGMVIAGYNLCDLSLVMLLGFDCYAIGH